MNSLTDEEKLHHIITGEHFKIVIRRDHKELYDYGELWDYLVELDAVKFDIDWHEPYLMTDTIHRFVIPIALIHELSDSDKEDLIIKKFDVGDPIYR